MLSDDQNIKTLAAFCRHKRYIELKLKVARLDLVSKVGVLLSLLVLGLVYPCCGYHRTLFVSATAAMALASIGGMAWACALIALADLLIGILLIIKRKAWILKPLLLTADRFVSKRYTAREEERND